ncbi:RNA helicase, partial [Streptomyces sp. SID1328]|nr:RNA helicase [Streptomyces sp. SID1328]
GRTARSGGSGSVVTLVLSGQRRELSKVTSEAGVEPTVTKVRSGEAALTRITGARRPSGTPLDGGPSSRPKNTNAPFRGMGSSKDTSGGRPSRKTSEARKLAEARRAAQVRRGR